MTKISKILVVVSAIASLIFLGVAVTSYIGGPNWQAEANELSDYTFERSGGETPTWTVKARRAGANGQQFTANSPVLAEVIIRARNDQLQRQRDELGRLDQDTPVYESRLQQAKSAIDADIKAMAVREKQLSDELQALSESINTTTNEAIEVAQKAEEIRTTAERRREEVFRLRNLLAEVRTDKFRAIEQQKKLEDLLVRLDGQSDRMERRREQLQSQGAKLPPAEDEGYNSPAPAGDAPQKAPANENDPEPADSTKPE